MKHLHIVLFLLLLNAKVIAGDFCIAPQLTYGKNTSGQLFKSSYEIEIFQLFRTTNNFIFLRTGAMISYERKRFSYTTGLLYSRVIIDQYGYDERFKGLNMLQLPLACNLHCGKKLYGYLSAGVYVNYLHSQQELYSFKFATFQAGITGGIGIGYRFGSTLSIDMVYRAENSLNPMYFYAEHYSALPWAGSYFEEVKVPFRTLALSLKYTIGQKNNENLSRHSSPASMSRSIRSGKHNRPGKEECIRPNF